MVSYFPAEGRRAESPRIATGGKIAKRPMTLSSIRSGCSAAILRLSREMTMRKSFSSIPSAVPTSKWWPTTRRAIVDFLRRLLPIYGVRRLRTYMRQRLNDET